MLSYLHFPTLLLFTLSQLVAITAVFALLVRLYPARRGLRYWLCGCVLLTIGYTFRLIDSLPGGVEIPFWWAGLCFLGGNLTIWLGILRFFGLLNRSWVRRLTQVILIAWGVAAALPYPQQLALNLVLGGLTCGLAGFALLRAKELEASLVRLSVAGVYLASGAILVIRGAGVSLPFARAAFDVEELSAIGAPLSTALIALRCFALLVLLHADQERLLRGLAATDVLTNLLNRQGFFEQVSRLLGRQSASETSSLLMLDLDYFKQVNDRYGHATGDVVLGRFAKALRRQLRPGDCIGRLGGEEFAALLVGATGNEAHDIAERVRRAWECEQLQIGDHILQCTVSIGICTSSLGNLDSRLLMADAALYRAKAEGRNRVAIAAATD